MKIYVVGSGYNYANWIEGAKLVYQPKFAEMLLFTGGADVSPALYGQPMGKYTSINKERDIRELEIYNEYKHLPKLGICRGAQLLTVLSGGKLIQHVENHSFPHDLITSDAVLNINSYHHQMMYPFDVEHKLLGWTKNISDVFLDGDDKNVRMTVEPEVVWYPQTRSFCIQGHPEMMKYGKTHIWLNSQMQRHMGYKPTSFSEFY